MTSVGDLVKRALLYILAGALIGIMIGCLYGLVWLATQ